jgi:hypothetical protein
LVMGFMPIQASPGISKSVSDYASGKPIAYQGGRIAQGRYTDGNHIRFVAGFPEKLGGWVTVTGFPAITGIPRAMKTWRDNNATPRQAIGTENHLYSWDGTTLIDISPLRTISAGTLGANPFTTTSGLATVAVADSSQTLVNGDWVSFAGATAVNGITVNGWYIVSGRSGTGYTITTTTTASGNGAGGGSAVTFQYPRITLGANPFSTINHSATVTVTHTAHGASTGDFVTFSGASAVAGLTINGEYQLTVVNANSYTINAGSAANATTTGGGSAVEVIYVITMNQLLTSQPVTYGQGVYGTGPYGYAQTSTPTNGAGWTLDRYGSQLLSCPIGGTIYVYDPSQGGRSHPLLNAPIDIFAMFVTPERFVVALGTVSSPLQMAWADQNDYTVWTSLPTNTAQTGRTIQGGTKFIGGAPVRDGVSLAITDKAAFQLNYSGDNFVYDSPEASDNASLVSPIAIGVLGEAAYWMSDSQFWLWNGTIQPIPSDDIRDYVFKNINRSFLSKCWVWVNRAKFEIWFNYPSAAATEIDSYVIWHTDQQCWSIGKWSGLAGSGVRTTGVDSDLFSTPYACDVNGVLYQHETGTDDAGQALDAYVVFSPVDVSNGDQNVDVFGFIPDFSRLSQSINLTINTRLYPQDSNTVTGPFTITSTDTTPTIDLRTDGKMVGFELDCDVIGGDFRFGVPRLNVQPAGARL